MTIHREILFFSDSADEVNKKEPELIRQYDSNNPPILGITDGQSTNDKCSEISRMALRSVLEQNLMAIHNWL